MDCDLGENSWLIHWEMGQVLIYIFRAIKLMIGVEGRDCLWWGVAESKYS